MRSDRDELTARYSFPIDRFQYEAFDALDDGRDGRAVILELLGAIGDIDAGTLADVFVIGAFIRILKPAPAAYVINQNDIEVGRA